MTGRIWVPVAIGLLFAAHTEARANSAGYGAPTQRVELSEAFPWDEPIEQTFTVDSVLRWRRGTNTFQSAPATAKSIIRP